MKKSLEYIKLVFVIVTMGYIFALSSQTGKISHELSYKFMIHLKEYIESANWIAPDLRELFLSSPVIATRKLAHLIIYFILGAGIYLILPIKWSVKDRIFMGISICSVYAMTDEIHQMFVPDRTYHMLDIIIDTIGGSLGVAVGVILNKLYMRIFKVTNFNKY